MPTKKVNQLPQITTLDSNDKFLVYDESASTTCYALYSQFGVTSQAGGGNYIDITSAPYNADKTGVNDISSALTSATSGGGKTIFFPAGTYKINTNLQIPAGTVFIGENKLSTILNITHTSGIKFVRNSNGAYDQDWLKSGVKDLTIKTAGTGILMDGLEFFIDNVLFSGGNSGYVAVDIQDSKYFFINNLNFGSGGGAQSLAGSFIRVRTFRGSTGWQSGAAVNYGHGVIQNVVGKLTSASHLALEFNASTYNPPSGDKPYIENILLQNVYLYTDNKPSNSNGIYFRQVRSFTLKNVNIVNFTYGVEMISDYAVPNSGSNIHNTFINCTTKDCDNPWLETTNPPGYSTFISCYNFGPKQPTGTSTTDYDSKRSPYDSALSGAMWFTKPNDGQLKAGIRLSPDGAFYLVGDIDYRLNSSTNYDGMPNLVTPTKNLAIGYPDNDSVQIFKTKQLSTLAIGNGENFEHSSVTIGPLHRVQVNDPLFLASFSTSLPTSYNINYNGLLANASSANVVSNTEFWTGPGVYSNESFDGTNMKFLPLVSKGRFPTKDIVTSSYSLVASDAQKILRFNYQSSNSTLNVGNNLIPSSAVNPSSDHRTSFKFTVKAHGNNVVIQPETNVNLIVGDQENVNNYTVLKGNTVDFIYSRNSNNTSNLEVCIPVSSAGSTNDLLWADSSSDLGGGTGYSWPGLYRKTGTNSWEFESRLNSGVVFRHLPQPTGSGSPSAFSLIHNGGNGTNGHTSITVSNLNIPAGKVVIWVNTGRDTNPPTISSITHPNLSNITERATQIHNSTSLNRTNRSYFFTATSNGGTGDLVITLSTSAWSSNVQVFHADDNSVGNFLGATFSSPVTSGTEISISRDSGGSAKVDICVCFAYISTTSATLSVSRDSSSYTQGTLYHSYKVLGSTRAAGQSIDNTTQTFTLSTGSYSSAIAGIIQFEGPPGGSTDYTITSNDLAKKLICQTGTTNITLPTLSLPSGSDSNGQTGIESFLMVEVPPSCTVNFYRGSGAQFWTGPNSGDVSGATVSCTSSQRKVIVLSVMPSGLWKIVSGEVD